MKRSVCAAVSCICTLFILSKVVIARLEITESHCTMHNDNTVSVSIFTHTYLPQCKTEFQKRRRPFLWLYMAALHTYSPWPRWKTKYNIKTNFKCMKSPNKVKSWKTCLLLGHLLYVVARTWIIRNLWRYTLLWTCYDTLTNTWIQIAALLSITTAPTFITRANLSKQFPTAMSIVSPNIL